MAAAPGPGSPDQFDFVSAVGTFYETFPGQENKVFFIDVATGAIPHPDPRVVQDLITLVGATETGKQVLRPKIAECREKKSCYTVACTEGKSIVLFYSGADRKPCLGGGITPAQELQFIFDHEAGHALTVEGRSGNRLRAENAADAFALLLDIRRNGADSPLAEEALLFRAKHALFYDEGMKNFSAPLIERIVADRTALAERPMTMPEMIALADDYTCSHALDETAARDFNESVAPLREKNLKALTGVLDGTPSPLAFKWVSTVAKAALEGRITIPARLAEEFNAAAAQELMDVIDRREKHFAAPGGARTPPRIS